MLQNPTKSVRLRSVLGPAIGTTVSTLWWYETGSALSVALAVIAVTLLLLAIFLPRWFSPVQSLVDTLIHWTLKALTLVLLAAVYVCIFVPGRLMLWIMRRDPLQKRMPKADDSYWQAPKPPRGAAHFARQY